MTAGGLNIDRYSTVSFNDTRLDTCYKTVYSVLTAALLCIDSCCTVF